MIPVGEQGTFANRNQGLGTGRTLGMPALGSREAASKSRILAAVRE